MNLFNSIPPLFISFFFVIFLSCTQSDEQRKFEREAISLPENITETRSNGTIIDDNSDPDDWRTSPFFQGIVFIDPAFPNPVITNQRLIINITVSSIDDVDGLRILVLYDESSFRPVYEQPGSIRGLVSISLDPLDIARFSENPAGLYRLILEDWDQNIISYGDVRVE